MTISMDKQYRTRDGREVRIYAVDTGPNQPIHGAHCEYKIWRQHTWDRDGKCYFGNSPLDLIEVKPRIKREYWVNVIQNFIEGYKDKETADRMGRDRIACVKITIDCEEGEGL
ncbi:MAG: hypothetical protein EB015_07405 [Methylocystaceae bacterium]|nr:hypothetical protein [Methylocystaceae bacterium]